MLTLIKTGHPEDSRVPPPTPNPPSPPNPHLRPTDRFMFLCLWRSDNPRKPARKVHQSSERGGGPPAGGSLECGVERNLYCPIVPSFPLSHHTPARPVHLQVRSANQPRIPSQCRILSSAATPADQQHEGARLNKTRARPRKGGSHRGGWRRTGDGDVAFAFLGRGGGRSG